MTGAPTISELFPPCEGMMVKFRARGMSYNNWIRGRYMAGAFRTRGDHWSRSEVIEWVYDGAAEVIPMIELCAHGRMGCRSGVA